jgi:hypothetical protein
MFVDASFAKSEDNLKILQPQLAGLVLTKENVVFSFVNKKSASEDYDD